MSLIGRHGGDGLVDAVGGELPRQPGVELRHHEVFAQVDVARVLDLVGQRVLLGEPAPVIRSVVGPLALHPPVADPAKQQSAQHVGVAAPVRLVGGRPGPARGQDLLDLVEGFLRDQGLMHDPLRPHPLVLVVPALFGGVAELHVVDVDEFFVLALLGPDLAAGVARVGQDHPDGALGPGDAGAVPVALAVVGRGRGDALTGQVLGELPDAPPIEEVSEDEPHHPLGLRVGHQAVHPLAVGGLGGVGVRADVLQHVSVRRAPAQPAPLHLSLGGHGGAHPGLDAGALSLGDPAVHRHDQFVGLVRGVDRPADLGHPELDAVVLEHRERHRELVAVERALRLADYHRIESAVGVGQQVQQPTGLRAPLRRHRAGAVDVEELLDDVPTVVLDQGGSARALPLP
nr:hypothetical protein [Streptomonospora salina]